MSVSTVKEYLHSFGFDGRVLEFDVSSATVELAAKALGTEPARIAKTISLDDRNGGCILVVAAGDVKIDNKKFKERFGIKATMLPHDQVLMLTGHAVGGVCPFALPVGTPVYLDESLTRFDVVYPAAGSSNSALPLSCEELLIASAALGYVDVCKPREMM